MPSELETLFGEFFQRPRLSAEGARLNLGPLLIYGAGSTGRDAYRVLTDAGMMVTAFLDASAKPGQTWQGVPVLRPDDSGLSAQERQRCQVIVCVFNPFADTAPIGSSLHAHGFASVLGFSDFHALFADELGDRFWLTARSFYQDARKNCEAVYDLLSDARSRELFTAVLRYRLLGELTVLPVPDLHDQYFPADLAPYPQPLRFIDGGAYQGDCLEQMLARKLKLDAVAAFEPDDANFVKLGDFVAAHPEHLPRDVYLFPCGLDSTARKVRFSSGQGTSSRVDSNGDTLIQCAAIDEALPGFAPTLVKLDIEGAELSALWGARQTLTKHRPALAISLYHKAAHLWQIPLLLADWYGARAKYHIRSHAYNGFELVLYVRPV